MQYVLYHQHISRPIVTDMVRGVFVLLDHCLSIQVAEEEEILDGGWDGKRLDSRTWKGTILNWNKVVISEKIKSPGRGLYFFQKLGFL